MEQQTITISMEQFMELSQLKANLNAAQKYIDTAKYPDEQITYSILGLHGKEDM